MHSETSLPEKSSVYGISHLRLNLSDPPEQVSRAHAVIARLTPFRDAGLR